MCARREFAPSSVSFPFSCRCRCCCCVSSVRERLAEEWAFSDKNVKRIKTQSCNLSHFPTHSLPSLPPTDTTKATTDFLTQCGRSFPRPPASRSRSWCCWRSSSSWWSTGFTCPSGDPALRACSNSQQHTQMLTRTSRLLLLTTTTTTTTTTHTTRRRRRCLCSLHLTLSLYSRARPLSFFFFFFFFLFPRTQTLTLTHSLSLSYSYMYVYETHTHSLSLLYNVQDCTSLLYNTCFVTC